MSPAIFETAKTAFSLLLTGAAIKLMDDFVDAAPGERWGGERSALPYALLFFAGGAAPNSSLTVSLFLAAYALGMAYDYAEKMPSGLLGYQESLLVVALGIVVLGWSEIAGSLLIIASIQLLDDVRDQQEDRYSGQKNLARRWGRVEAGLLAAITFLATLLLAPVKAVATLAASLLVTALFARSVPPETERWMDYDF